MRPARAPVPAHAAGGFTLVEMLTVLTVLAGMLTFAVPGLGSFVAGQRLQALAFDLTSDLLLARSEALTRNTDVVVERVGASWDGGWVVRVGATAVSRRNGVASTVRFDGAPELVRFDMNGRVGSSSQDLRITLSSTVAGAAAQRCVALDLSGRARATVGACE